MQEIAETSEMEKLKEEENQVKDDCFDEISAIAVDEIRFLYKKEDEEQLDD
jgi:hypothetical protein